MSARFRTIISIFALTFWKGVGMSFGIAIAIGIANLFGAGVASDTYFFARKLVSNIAMGFERAFQLVQVPPLIARARSEGMAALRLHLGRLSRRTFLITCFVAGIGIIFAPQVISFLAPGFDDEQVARTVPFLQVLLLTVPISAVTSLSGATLNALRLFSLPAIARLLPKLFVLISLLIGATAFGIGLLPLALLAGTLCMGVFFFYATFRALQKPDDFEEVGDGSAKVRYGRKRIVAMVIAQAHMIGASWIDMAYASLAGSGGVSVLEFGQRLTNVAPGVAVNSVTSVYYTEFSRSVSAEDNAEFRAKISEALRTAFFFAVPLAAMILALAEPAVDIVLRHGAFSGESARTTTHIVELLVLLLPVNAVLGVTVSVIFADHRLPHIKIIVSSVGLAIAVRVVLAAQLVGTLGVISVPIASLASMCILFILCLGWVWALIGPPLTMRDLWAMPAICLASAADFVAAEAIFSALEPFGATRISLAAITGVAAMGSGVAFLVTATLLRLQEVTHIIGKIYGKLRR